MFLHMGKFGDIIALLPAYQRLAQWNGRPVRVGVSPRWECVFDRLSYVEKVPIPWPNLEEVGANYRHLASDGSPVMVCQMGTREARGGRGPTWEHDFYRCAWSEHLFRCTPPVFDRRDRDREEEFCQRLPRGGRGAILYNLMAETSPLRADGGLRMSLKKAGGIDLGEVRPQNIVDLLGAYERARVLVTLDTATLHLAKAVPSLRVIQLSPAKAFLRTERIPNAVMQVNYWELDRKVGDILLKIKRRERSERGVRLG